MKKIDLHMHTTYSDGAHSVKELLTMANNIGLDTIAITDHNTVDAHKELEQNNYSSIFGGKIIKGVEIYAHFNGKVVELLVYDYDLEEMKKYLDERFSSDWNLKRKNHVQEKIKQVAKTKGYKFDEDFDHKEDIGESGAFFRHLKSFKENHNLLDPDLLSGKKSFFRHYVTNSATDFFVDTSQIYPSVAEIVNLAKATGGKVFLAHTYEYSLTDKDVLDLFAEIKNTGATGIEAYYPTFSKEQVEFVLNYCKQNNLLVSGGSDFHGGYRPNVLGTLNQHVQINLENFNWVLETKNTNN